MIATALLLFAVLFLQLHPELQSRWRNSHNSSKYQTILAQNLSLSAKKLKLKRNFTLHSDKDPEHILKCKKKRCIYQNKFRRSPISNKVSVFRIYIFFYMTPMTDFSIQKFCLSVIGWWPVQRVCALPLVPAISTLSDVLPSAWSPPSFVKLKNGTLLFSYGDQLEFSHTLIALASMMNMTWTWPRWFIRYTFSTVPVRSSSQQRVVICSSAE